MGFEAAWPAPTGVVLGPIKGHRSDLKAHFCAMDRDSGHKADQPVDRFIAVLREVVPADTAK
jgi:hypothetical protein